MPFNPGVSGSPNGRPLGGTSLAERIREKGGPDGRAYVDMLHGIAMNEMEGTRFRIEAEKILLQRGYGSPPEEVHVGAQQIIGADELRSMLEEERMLAEAESESAPDESEPARKRTVEDWLDGRWPDP